MKSKSFALLFFLFAFPAIPFAADHPWQLTTDKEGIQIYKRSVDGSPVLEFKGEVKINSPVEKVVELYEQEKRMSEWFHSCTYSELLDHPSPNEKTLYFTLAMPWPVSNRDVVYKRTQSLNKETGAVEYNIIAVPDRLALKAGHVRIPYARVLWSFTPLKEGGTHVVYQQHSSAGGYIPNALVNRLTTQMPFYTLKKLRDLMEKEAPLEKK